MSNSDESEIAESQKEVADELDDNVSLISIRPGCAQFKSILLRVVLAVLFLAVGIGAVAYSVLNSEKDESGTEKFSIHINQKCYDGSYTVRYQINNSSQGTNESTVTTFKKRLWWQQNDDTKKLLLFFGLEEDNVHYEEKWEISSVTLVHEDQNNQEQCRVNNTMSYDSFIDSLCLSTLRRNSSEDPVKIDDRDLWKFSASVSCIIDGKQASNIEAYLDPQDEVVIGWEVHFHPDSDIQSIKYWFPTMAASDDQFVVDQECR